jgi:hypothetical protein
MDVPYRLVVVRTGAIWVPGALGLKSDLSLRNPGRRRTVPVEVWMERKNKVSREIALRSASVSLKLFDSCVV